MFSAAHFKSELQGRCGDVSVGRKSEHWDDIMGYHGLRMLATYPLVN